jgi:ZPR1 zinc finger protein
MAGKEQNAVPPAEEPLPITFKPIGQITENALHSGAGAGEQQQGRAAEDGGAEHAAEHAHEDGEEEEEEEPRNKITYEAGGEITVLKSLCMACMDQGVTRLLLTRIPFFRDVIIMSFECEHCGFRSSEVQPAEVQEKGCRFEVHLTTPRDLNRQLVKGDKAAVTLPELDFEIPAITQAGVFTTIEGLLDRAVENLASTQVLRRAVDEASADAVEGFLDRLRAVREGRTLPFTLILDDPSGNSFVENPYAPKSDPGMRIRNYQRTAEQNEQLGLSGGNARTGAANADETEGGAGAGAEEAAVAGSNAGAGAGSAAAAAAAAAAEAAADDNVDSSTLSGSSATSVYQDHAIDRQVAAHSYQAGVDRMRSRVRDMSGNVPGGFRKGGALIHRATDRAQLTESGKRSGTVRDAHGGISGLIFDSSSSDSTKEVMRFPQDCFNCSAKGEVMMCVTDVPHFKEIILMSFSCEDCGYKNVEVKGGGAVPPTGTVHELCYTPGKAHSEADMTRDVIKGDTAAVELPELEVELAPGTLGGMYTTVEGLLSAIRDKLAESDPFSMAGGDSADRSRSVRMHEVMDGLEACVSGARAFTLRMRDPMANTWIYSPFEGVVADLDGTKGQSDPVLTVTPYVRSEDEDLELGLLDMNAPRGEEDDDAAEEGEKADGAPA